jgi:hypothetical protein
MKFAVPADESLPRIVCVIGLAKRIYPAQQISGATRLTKVE